MSEYVVTDTELTAVADAIRTKGGTQANLKWYADFVSAIGAISGGGGGSTNILSGTDAPTSSVGEDGDIYLQTGSIIHGALLEFETSTTDDAISKTWNTSGSPMLSSDQAKFGSKSLYLDGSSYLESAVDADDFNFGSGDFTIACWIYPTVTSRAAVFAMSSDCKIGTDIFFGQGSANLWLSSNGYSWNLLQSDNSGSNTGQGTIALQANTWTHIAFVRKGVSVRMYVNGQIAREANISSSASVAWNGSDGFRIGAWGNGSYKYKGYIDDFVVVKGSAIWSDTFTPPSQPFTILDIIIGAYLKVNGAWQALIGSDIEDVNTGSES